MALRYEVASFEPAHAAAHLRVTMRAYAGIPAHARPTHDEAFHRRMHDDSNPAGPSLVAIARDGDTEIGMVSAVPARFRTSDGSILIGYQPTSLVVDAAVRARGLAGIGTRLSKAIVDAAAGRDGAFVYAYPNQRSIRIADWLGFDRIGTVPTYLFPGIRLSNRTAGGLRDGRGLHWTFEPVHDPADVHDASPGDPLDAAMGFVRDRAYFDWRFGGPAASRYAFVLCRAPDPRESFVVACTQHRMKGVPFTVLVDGYPPSFLRHFRTAVRAVSAATGRRGVRIVYVTTNLPSTDLGARNAFRWGVPVPARFHPRPFNLVFHAARTNLAPEDLRRALAMTGDWLGF